MTTKSKLVPTEPSKEMVEFCEDTALSLAERTFSSEVDEHLAEDVIQYARRLHDVYTAPQSAPEVTKLVEVLRKMQEQAEESYHNCYAECCGKYTNKGCCGDYVQAWSERDRVVMETLGEHINKLSELLSKQVL